MAGRDDVIGEVMAVVEGRRGRGIVLAGQAGVGKSRVAWEAAGRASATKWSVRTITATANSQHVPLGACAQWTDDVGGGEAALVRRVGEAMVAGTAPGRLLLVVDDAHLLDDLSVLVVQHLVGSGAATVVMTIRVGEPMPAALSAWVKDGEVAWREVLALSREHTSAVLTAAFGASPDPDCGDRFWKMTGGNALFVRQLAEQEAGAGRLTVQGGALRWSGDVAVSSSLAEVVERQVGALPGPVLEVVDAIAVAEPLDRRSLALLARPDAVEEAEDRGLIRITGDEVCVGHPLFAEIRRARCGHARLARLRGQVAMAMGGGGSAVVMVKRGLLWLESNLPVRPEVLVAAGGAANSLLDFDLAERLFAAAAEAGVGPRAHVSRAWTLFMMGDGDTAGDVLAAAPREGEVGPGFRNEVVLAASTALWAQRDPEQAWQIVEEALRTETGERRAQILVFRANQLALAGRTPEVLRTLDQVDDRELEPYGTAMACIAACMAHGEQGHLDQVATAVAVSARALESTIESRAPLRPPRRGPCQCAGDRGTHPGGRGGCPTVLPQPARSAGGDATGGSANPGNGSAGRRGPARGPGTPAGHPGSQLLGGTRIPRRQQLSPIRVAPRPSAGAGRRGRCCRAGTGGCAGVPITGIPLLRFGGPHRRGLDRGGTIAVR